MTTGAFSTVLSLAHALLFRPLGLDLAWGGSRLVRHLLYGAAIPDAVFYAGAVTLVVAVGLFACAIPAGRAARLEPATALRDE